MPRAFNIAILNRTFMKRNKSNVIAKAKDYLCLVIKNIANAKDIKINLSQEVKNNFFTWNHNLIENQGDSKSLNICYLENNNFNNSNTDNLLKDHRALADMACCYLMFHNSSLHQQKIFNQEEQIIFDDFEKIRVLLCIYDSYFGSLCNILDKIDKELDFNYSISPILLILKNFFSKSNLLDNYPRINLFAKDLENKTSIKIKEKVKKISLKIHDQNQYSKLVEELIAMLRKKDDQYNNKNKKDSEEKTELTTNNIENIDSNVFQEEESSKDYQEKIDDLEKIEKKIIEIEDRSEFASIYDDKSIINNNLLEFRDSYKIFSSKFDEIIFPQKLVSKNELQILRNQLDIKLSKLNNISKKISIKLKRKLLSKQNSFLDYDSSRGLLNRKKLTQLVIDPLSENIWIDNKNHQYQNTALTILLDNSGSMRGNPIVMSSLACEIIAEILEKFTIKTEIIGYTTADWRGGRARKLWEVSGREKNPGRLNELRHIVYKHFNQNFKKSRINLGLMLKEGILKENIDGEALLFARSRLMQQNEKRKILIVISDGTPVDDSTNSSNDKDILSDHLHHVVNKIEKQSSIEIVGIGIGHSIEEFYRNSITIRTIEELGDVMIKKICELL